VYNYAHIGDVLEFTALDPNTSPFWVIFEDPSPCAEKFVMVTKDKPGQCKVTAQLDVYYYILSKTPPPTVPIPPPPVGHPTAAPRKCPQCQIMLIAPPPTSPSGPPSTTSNSPTLKSEGLIAPKTAANENPEPEQIKCDSNGNATVNSFALYQNDRVFWLDSSRSNVTVTVPTGCSDDNNNPKTTFNTMEDTCKLTGTPKTYSYTVQAPTCANPGTATFTIVAPPK
jgi:hypothetical protein